MLGLLDFAGLLLHTKNEIEQEASHAVKKAGEMCAEKARSAVGTYEYGWPPLSPSTLEKKSGDTPLLETGQFQGSIQSTMQDKMTALVSSSDGKAGWFEYGTSKMPPRPVFGPTADVMEPEMEALMVSAVSKAIS